MNSPAPKIMIAELKRHAENSDAAIRHPAFVRLVGIALNPKNNGYRIAAATLRDLWQNSQHTSAKLEARAMMHIHDMMLNQTENEANASRTRIATYLARPEKDAGSVPKLVKAVMTAFPQVDSAIGEEPARPGASALVMEQRRERPDHGGNGPQ